MSIAFPPACQSALEQLLTRYSLDQLTCDAQTLSENYRERTGAGRRLLTAEREAAAYAAARMPATFAAIAAALQTAIACAGLAPKTLLDCGAGTGAGSWAAAELLPLERVVCLERESAMRAVGSALMKSGSAALACAEWVQWDMTEERPLPRAELVLEGYMLGELAEEQRLRAAERLWAAAERMLLLVEPGTPKGFQNLRSVRSLLTARGARVAAPCPAGTEECPMAGDDWCHFVARLPRTKLQKALKGGEAPFEDEKYACLALVREEATPCAARVLRHPQIAPGRIALTLCERGEIRQRIVTKKDPLWKQARKAAAGDGLQIDPAR